MKTLIVNSIVTLSLVAIGLSACSKAGNNVAANKVQSSNAKASQEASSFEYVSIEGFSYDLAKFVGLVEGETFAESEVKINAVFKAYDGHANPLDIRMESDIVEAGWKQVLVTQDGLMDGTCSIDRNSAN